MLPFFLTVLLKKMREPWKSDVIAGRVVSHGHVSVGRKQLHVGHSVNGGFAVTVVILTDL
uniref:Uncharacterized protein n=1 Tax=Anguilla anguilla TaxID=7936 RepID=A0A0E9RGE9_ANGAN